MEQTSGPAGPPFSLADLKALNAEIAALARARLPLNLQLRRLGRELPGRSGELAVRIGTRIENGASLSEALAAEGKNVPEVYRAVVEAGERVGRLPTALEALVDSGGRLDQLRRATGAALVYPLMLVLIAWLMVAAVLAGLLPAFAWFEYPRGGSFQQGLRLPQTAATAAMVVATIVVVLMAAWWWRSGRAAAEDRDASGFWSRFPWLGQVRQLTSIATFAELLRLMIEQDTPLEEALPIAARATGNTDLRAAAEEIASHIAAGEFEGVPRGWRFPSLIALALRHADNRPLMVSTLAQAAALYRQRAVTTAQYASEYLPVLLVAGIGGLAVVALVTVVLWPYILMIENLSRPVWN